MSRVERWERHTEIPLLLLALGFLVAYALPIIDRHVPHGERSELSLIAWCVWAAFAADFIIRLGLAERRVAYAKSHWYDVALIALPMLRPLRLLRVLALARIMNRSVRRTLAERVTVYVVGTSISAVFLGALAVLDAEEKSTHANITSFGDALWWACSTVTTVGYGDRYPVTTEGRFVGVALMIVGIALVGSVTAAVAAWFVSNVQDEHLNRADRE